MMPDTSPEKPKRDAEKRKRLPVARWQILLAVSILILVLVWSVNTLGSMVNKFHIQQTADALSTQREVLSSTADSFFAPSNTAFAATMQTILATQPADVDEFEWTATSFVRQVTLTVYLYQLETLTDLTTITATSDAKNH
jgi:type II secretory pathway component PulL